MFSYFVIPPTIFIVSACIETLGESHPSVSSVLFPNKSEDRKQFVKTSQNGSAQLFVPFLASPLKVKRRPCSVGRQG